jgi:glycosyltransferase involved in cell wall biosynthesis
LPEVKRPFVFSVTGADDRKNTEALVSAYARLPLTFRREHQLVITCFMPLVFEQKWRQHARQVGLREDEVLLTNLVAEDVLRSLYQTAALFVFPSLYEGFGLPVAEAIACGCPTITSSVSSIPEILDWEPSTFDPSNPDAISCAIERGLSDHEFRDGLRAIAKVRAPIHTWGTVAERTVAAMAKLPKPPTAPRSKPALRLALVGPLPPARSGIADYNARLAAELAKHCQLDLLSDVGASHVLSETLHGVRRFPTRALGRTLNPASYDAIIYTIGGSEHHHDTYEAAARYPGIVWFHDIRLDGLYRTYALARQPSGGLRFLMEKAAQAYGQRLPQHFGWNGAAYDPEAADRFGLFLTRELVSWARGVIVNSDCAARLVELDQGPDASFQPIRELPFAVPTRIATTHRPYEHHPVIASFGVVHKVKGPKHLINALRHVRATVPARLVFVGDVSEVLLAELTELTGQLGLNDSVEFTGHVSQVEYERYLHEASCAIQLRLGMLGQNSAALSDCLSIGLPTITDIVATNDEFANYAIVRLSPTFDESDLASQAVGLLTDPVMWQQYHCGALDHARGHTFDHVAVSLVDIVRDLVHSSR